MKLRYGVFVCIVAVLKAIAYLPRKLLLLFGLFCGRALYLAAPKLVHISRTNISLCFPHLSSEDASALLRKSFDELGLSLVETFFVWFRKTDASLKKTLEVEGAEHWESAVTSDKGLILLSCHSGSLDLNLALINQLDRKMKKLACTYRQPSDAVIDRFLQRVRRPNADHVYPVSQLLSVSRILKAGGIVWYAPDIETSKKGRVFVKFMGVEAATPSGVARIAASSGAQVLPFMHTRKSDGGYRLTFFPMLNEFPQGEVEADTQTINNAIENIVCAQPATYWWSIKRFRYRQDGSPSPYLV